jgi:hypothetical protein
MRQKINSIVRRAKADRPIRKYFVHLIVVLRNIIMKARTIPSVSPGESLEVNESLIVTGNVGEGARLNVTGDLDIKEIVKPGAEVIATRNVIVGTALGPDTTIKSEQASVSAGKVIGDVNIQAPGATIIGIRMDRESAAMLFGTAYTNKLFAPTPSAPTKPADTEASTNRLKY